ncbi:sugar phosphate isomerase/epimerase family protein [Fimbriimonas ginsengisoli]|uniref:Xylose isomerase domain-containing protein n=1 Tax=Fimbriimonas ginsengisoli Gsoil 348 TaxID=661478 RepID=A0A068NU85_FIMGI|nr:TIM barrel protein [Fimbriimonas ginsengisoli]AIE87058.1 xylose isomerase domain-containing protein [Fimbriimonas ginsengisoli Gsoil 348]
MGHFDRYNDGSQNTPRLQIQHSLWSLIGLPMNSPTEWTIAVKLSRVKAAGFEGVECWLSDEDEAERRASLDAEGLRLTLGHHPHTLDDVRATVARAKRLKADFVFAQPLNPFYPIKEAAEFCREARKIANGEGIAFFVETHRNNIPESLNQALELIEYLPEVRFTGDFSHFVVVSEFYGLEYERAVDRLMPVLSRTSHLHGRISNGEQVQVDVGDGSGQTAQFFVRIWTAAMREWRKGAGPGDVFPFASELGPPRYAITLPDGKEFSDRWEQSLIMKRLAEQAWAASA